MLNHKQIMLNYKDSLRLFQESKVSCEPFEYLENKHFKTISLLIGYTDGDAVVIYEEDIGVAYIKVSKKLLSTYYHKRKRPSGESSIFRKPRVGNTLLCVAEERYANCKFGETYVVKDISVDGRISFNSINTYTYDSKYFVVVDSFIKDNAPHPIFESDMDAMKYAKMGVDPYKESIVIKDRVMSRGVDIGEMRDELTVRKILDVDELIVIKNIKDTELMNRKIYSSELIVRK